MAAMEATCDEYTEVTTATPPAIAESQISGGLLGKSGLLLHAIAAVHRYKVVASAEPIHERSCYELERKCMPVTS